MARFQTVIKSARFVYSAGTATEMQDFAQVLADSIWARIQSGQNIYDQAAAPLKPGQSGRRGYPDYRSARGHRISRRSASWPAAERFADRSDQQPAWGDWGVSPRDRQTAPGSEGRGLVRAYRSWLCAIYGGREVRMRRRGMPSRTSILSILPSLS
jgi:hypothetical protein